MDLSKIRNIGLMAHIDAGKTTTTERILYYTKKIHKLGEVDEGTATMDWMPEEQERGITITSAATTSFWKDCRINIIDTPGHVDFTVEVERSLRILDGAIVVICGVGGVEPQTETVWRQGDRYAVPRLAYINKLDRMGADFEKALESMRVKLKGVFYPVQYPIGTEADFRGIIDLIEKKEYHFSEDQADTVIEKEVSEDHLEILHKFRSELIEHLSELDDSLMQVYIEGKEPSVAELKKVLRRLTVAGKIFPVFCGSSFKNKGIQPLLDGVLAYLPSPLDKADITGVRSKGGEQVVLKNSASESFSALAFKVAYDSYIGRMVYVRIYSGTLKKGDRVFNATKDRKERVGRILLMHANHQEDKECIEAGEIAVFVGLKFTKTGDTLCNEYSPILLEIIQFPEPVICMAVETKSQADTKKLEEAIEKLTEEDPTLKISMNTETGQRLISGMGELHLEIIKERMLREYNLDIRVGNPQVAYKETIRLASSADMTVDKMLGNTRIFAALKLKLEPTERGSGNRIAFTCKDNQVPLKFRPSIEDSLRMCAMAGASGIYPLTDVLITVLDGQFSEADSSESAFQLCASQVFDKALRESRAVLLEPIMKMDVYTPEAYSGEIIGDLNSRRGKITDMEIHEQDRVIMSEVPLSSLFGYATILRSLSKGRAHYNMEPLKFEPVPKEVEEKIFNWKQF